MVLIPVLSRRDCQLPANAEPPAGLSAPGFYELSARERRVLALASELTLSEHTVKRHVGNILTNLNLPTRAAVAALAARAGLR